MDKIEKELFNRISNNNYDSVKGNAGTIKIGPTTYTFKIDMKYHQLAYWKGIGFFNKFKLGPKNEEAYNLLIKTIPLKKIKTKAIKIKKILMACKGEAGKMTESILHFKIGTSAQTARDWFEKEFNLNLITLEPLTLVTN